MIITKKIYPVYFEDILDGKKKFEIRTEDDFSASIGDFFLLKEWDKINGYSGRSLIIKISYIHRGFPLPDGLVVFGFNFVRSLPYSF